MCSNKYSHFQAFVSKFDLRFCRSIGGTTYPVNAESPNNNLPTDKRPQKHHQKSSKICSNKHFHFQAFVSKFDLRFWCSIAGTTNPVNATLTNDN
jgi:hypothetical protein